ncbi:unnamed protein product [Clonostachys chloroleuca]|uniref:Uncharacterized protein n=1 Tax=Clonostachys chloroleuca TaxID=1926264 RepID=A0AA35MBA4_9HYPO|nr:unnamed protein product [Clonostachys chloroleuca]
MPDLRQWNRCVTGNLASATTSATAWATTAVGKCPTTWMYANDDDASSSSWDSPALTKPTTSTSWRGPSRSSLSSGHGASGISTSTSETSGAPNLSRLTSGQNSRTSSSDEWRGPDSSPATSAGSHSHLQHTSSPSPSPSNSAEETQFSTETGADPAETGAQAGTPDQQDRLSNGATAGIVMAAMTVLLGIIFLGRYLYKKRRRERRRAWHDDSSGIGPYHSDSRHDPPAPAAPRRSVFQDAEPSQLNNWMAHHRPSRNRAPRSWSGSPSPVEVQPESVELRSYTRPARPKLFEVGSPGMPGTMGEPSNTRNYADPVPRQQPGVEGEMRGREATAPLRGGQRAAVLPWEEGPRPDRWAAY